MDSTKPVALWIEPEPATRSEQLIAISTVCLIGVGMVLAVFHLFLMITGLVPINNGEWGFADVSYLALTALLSVLVLVHASLGEDALRPRTMIVLSSVIGGIGTLMALTKGWLMLIGLLYSDESWRESAVFALVVMSIVPFALPFASGVILARNDFEPVRWRVRAVSIAVGAAALIIMLAALIPRWARLAEKGVW
ncbi:hypothetical protein DXT68_08045 [Microbacterium foliorum]|uniref:Uncharacterized protein n=1 Tax=Microbacterium foliorum TaxID=104336 RepID=A0A0F0KEP8_9MICO|nr:hypothetical protein [Microbacterium foliorum]AXL12091.1 hypothetical protein DXT68_08045 [Microbacterium foliorum]KJL17736.1 hypothetical protein RN50_02835 [Microbacterium foliorum]